MAKWAALTLCLVLAGCPSGEARVQPVASPVPSVASPVSESRETRGEDLELVDLEPVDSRRSPLESYLAPHSSESEPFTVTER